MTLPVNWNVPNVTVTAIASSLPHQKASSKSVQALLSVFSDILLLPFLPTPSLSYFFSSLFLSPFFFSLPPHFLSFFFPFFSFLTLSLLPSQWQVLFWVLKRCTTTTMRFIIHPMLKITIKKAKGS